MKPNGEPIVMVTAYDFPSAQVAEEAGVDIVLVGDTAAMVVLGYDAHDAGRDGRDGDHGGRGAPRAADAAADRRPAVRLLRDAPTSTRSRTRSGSSGRPAATPSSSSAGGASVERARAIAGSGIPVMGHVGLTPQIRQRAGRLQDAGPDRRVGGADRARTRPRSRRPAASRSSSRRSPRRSRTR